MNQLTTTTSSELAALGQQLEALTPQFEEVMGPSALPPARVIRTLLVSVQANPKLLECSRQSILNAAMTAAILGLEVDGVTGQGFLIPFSGRAQLCIGYKGYNTMAARSGYTINASVVREGDEFSFQEGTEGFVYHIKKLGNKERIIAAWAVAEAKNRKPILSILSIEEILAVKAKSPGAKKSASPWNDPEVGFPAMAEKTARRRLARSMPLNVFQLGATMDEAFEERGLHSRIDAERGVVIEGDASPLAEREKEQPSDEDIANVKFPIVKSDGETRLAKSIQEWKGAISMGIARMTTKAQAEDFLRRNAEGFEKLRKTHLPAVDEVLATIRDAIRGFEEG